MTEVVYRAPAKVNLGLRCSSRRPDGYHNLITVFMAVALADTLTCTPLAGRVEVDVSGEGANLIPTDGSDLTGRAATLLRDRFGDPGMGARLVVDKAIPVAGGMAGGSADAAAALRACNDLWDLGVSEPDLMNLAADLGADVPFALLGGVALGVGRGDVLTPQPVRGTYHWVFALARHGLSTPEVFAKYDEMSHGDHDAAELDDLIEVLTSGDASLLGAQLINDLTPAAVTLRPEIGETLAFGAALPGVVGSVLSGSGPTCAFLCDTEKAADNAAARLPELPQVASTRVADGPVGGAGHRSRD
ncbi:MAG: 4-(cytidine 5'-diphospho)-2-C-methyl-D-erythritol kinase [Propionibacteriaceae bacterium]|nr:4-(cytidine 5'-diphospho)-2-C-methyl-D-erythritol kinase [Propionibacteriaceae bacterium]